MATTTITNTFSGGAFLMEQYGLVSEEELSRFLSKLDQLWQQRGGFDAERWTLEDGSPDTEGFMDYVFQLEAAAERLIRRPVR